MSDMYVYFNDSNNIISVSGRQDATLSARYARFPQDEVAGFVMGTMNINDYIIKENRKTGKVVLEKKVTHEILVRTIDNILYELPNINKQFQIKVLNNIENKELFFMLDVSLRNDITGAGDSITINGVNELNFFFTKLNDPHFLKKHIRFSVEEFINSDISIVYTEDLEDISVYTKRIYDDYIYEEVKNGNT